ncbi:MAG: restriction endonuclease subunit S [Methanomassiliicoccales archaeon]
MSEIEDISAEWIRSIPNGWRLLRIKNCCTLNGRIGWQGLKSSEFTGSGPYLITGTDFYNGDINWETCVHFSKERFSEAPEIHIKNGDLLITKDGTVGKVAIVRNAPSEVSLNSGILLIRINDDVSTEFLYFVLISEIFWLWFNKNQTGNSTILHLYQNKFYKFPFLLPLSSDYQNAIASYLKQKCTAIDSSINKILNQIDLLEEFKKAIITEVITKGLDPKVPMKESGVNWIGKIPENWIITKLKKVSRKIGSGKTPRGGANTYSTSGVLFIRSQNVKDSCLDVNDAYYISKEIDEEMRSTRVVCGDVLLNITGASIGRSCIYTVNYEANVNQHVCIIRPDVGAVSSRYLHYCLISHIGTNIVNSYQTKSNREGLTFEQIGNSVIPLPPVESQYEICNFIDEKCFNIVSTINLLRKQIQSLEHLKKSLIFEYVTGKKQLEVMS